MRYTVRKSYIDVVGYIWMPNVVASLRITLTAYDLDNMRPEDGPITRDDVDQWLASHAGDFREVIDFYATIEDGDQSLEFDWATEDGETAYLDSVSEVDA